MGYPFTVRPARMEDFPALGALWREIDALHAQLQPKFFRPPRGLGRSEAQVSHALAGPDEVIFVAEPDDLPDRTDGASLCGLVHLRVYSTPPSATMVARRRTHVEDLVVASWARLRGCGRGLMARAAAWAVERDATQLVLTVWAGNDAAEAFYRRLGYLPVGTVMGLELPGP